MALAQLVVQVPGTLIKSGDWNNEFQNILTHPIALISPTTGPINFNLQAHTNLLPSVISATSASAGQALIDTGGATVWGTPTINSSNIGIAAGSTGQVFAVTSSNSAPAFQTLPIDGGLSTFTPTAGMVYFIGSSAANLKGLTIGSSGQVLMTGSSGVPVWSNLTTGGSGGGGGSFSTGNDITWAEDFLLVYSTSVTNGAVGGISQVWSSAQISTAAGGSPIQTLGMGNFFNQQTGGGQNIEYAITRQSSGPGALNVFATGSQGGSILWGQSSNFASTTHFSFKTRMQIYTTVAGNMQVGFSTANVSPTSSCTGIYLTVATTNTVTLQCVASSAGATAGTVSAGVSSTAWHTYQIDVTSSQVTLTVDGVSQGSVTSTSQIPNTPLSFVPLWSPQNSMQTSAGVEFDYFQIVSTNSIRV